jgi:hypothetical protein
MAQRPPGIASSQPQALPQPGKQGVRGEQLDPRCGQLNRRRQPVQAAADGGDVGGVVRGEGETRPSAMSRVSGKMALD